MIAIDTNVLVRFVVDDDHEQADRAEALLRANQVLIPRTVLLESEWVLRSRYRCGREAIGALLEMLLSTENLVVEAADQVEQALRWYRLGADFADALHLAACGTATMHTFDKSFCEAAVRAGVAPPVSIIANDMR